MANILVTGSRGFIGSNLTLQLLRCGHKVSGFVQSLKPSHTFGHTVHISDITNETQVRRVLEFEQPEVIIHLAGNAIVKENQDNPTAITRTNVLGTHNLLAHAPQGCHFILASSATVYGDNFGDQANETAKLTPTSVYGATKVAAESLVEAYTSLGKVTSCILRLVANVGQFSTHGLLHDIIRKLKSDSEMLELLGDKPGSYKPYTHVSDTVRAFTKALSWNGTYNISTTTTLSVEQVASIAMQELNIFKEIHWLGAEANWKGDNRVVCVNPTRARLQGNFVPLMESQMAIKQAIRDILESSC